MTRLFFIAICFLMFVSCRHESPKAIAYYSDGSPITDQTHLLLLKRKLPKLLKKLHVKQRDLRIHTSLQSGVNTQLGKSVSAMQEAIYPHLKWEHREQKAQMDSLKKLNEMLDVGVVVIDNRTGQILVHYASWARPKRDAVTCRRDIGSLNRTFLYAMAMQLEFKPSDRYPQTQQFFNSNADTTTHFSFYEAFRGYSNAISPRGLESRYSSGMAKVFAEQLQLNAYSRDASLYLFNLNVSMTNLAKTWSAFYNGGIMREPTVIERITDSKGHLLYKRKLKQERVLSKETASEMMIILDFYTTVPRFDYRLKTWYPDAPDYIGNFGRLTFPNGSGIFMAIHGNYTIGVCNYLGRRNLRILDPRLEQVTGMTVPVWMETVKQLTKHHRPPGTIQHEFKQVIIPEEETIDI